MLLLVDYRSDDVSRGHGLRRLRSELRRRRTLQEIAVEGLAAAAVSGLLERTLGAAVAPSLCDAVFDRTDGVPFFVTELGLALAVGERLGAGGVPDLREREGAAGSTTHRQRDRWWHGPDVGMDRRRRCDHIQLLIRLRRSDMTLDDEFVHRAVVC